MEEMSLTSANGLLLSLLNRYVIFPRDFFQDLIYSKYSLAFDIQENDTDTESPCKSSEGQRT